MDIDSLKKVVAELADRLVGAKVAKIHQPAADLLILRLWTGRENLKLLLSASATDSRIHLTEKTFPNPFTPPRFCQLLRARLSRITGVRQLNEDRIVELNCEGAKGACSLIVELIGKSSNLILVDDNNQIIDALRRFPGQQGRTVSAGVEYALPERLQVKEASFPEGVMAEREISSASASVENLYSSELKPESTTELQARLVKVIRKEQKKLVRRQVKIQQEYDKQQGFERFRQIGDLLLANRHRISRGMEEIKLENFYQQPPEDEKIMLNPVLTPQQNVEKYFQKYKKSRRGLEHSERRLAETATELEWLAELEYQLQAAADPADIAEIAAELRKAGLLKENLNKLPRVQKTSRPAVNEKLSPHGFRVLLGSNSRQNDYLSTRELKKDDLWFHAHRCPGSHVVLKSDSKGSFTEEDIEFAASIAAAHSKGKNDIKVEVIIAKSGDVKKPSGAKPGMVTVKKYKTLVVKPFAAE